MSTNLQTLPIDQLQANPFQPRDKVKTEDIQELSDSIKIHGILEPLVVAHTPAGYQIIAGERRWRAAKLAGLDEVPVHIKETTPKGMLEMAIVENVQRSDLNPLERAQAFKRLIDEFNLTLDEVAKRVGKSGPFVSNCTRLLKLPDAIKDALSSGEITEGHGRALIGLIDGDEKLLMKAYRQIVKEKASVRRAEDLVRHYKQVSGAKLVQGRNTRLATVNEADLAKIRQSLQSQLRHKSDLKLMRTNRRTRITITLFGDTAMTQSDLDKVMEIIGGN